MKTSIQFDKMDLSDFLDWATGYFILYLIKESPRALMWVIFNTFMERWLPSHGWKHD